MIERIYVVITAMVGLLKIVVTQGTSGIVTDEIQYKEMILGLGEKHLFNPVYVLTYKTALIGGDNWYLMVKLINLGMILVGCLFIIGICKNLGIKTERRSIIYMCTLLSGTTTYMMNTMPESMFTAVLYGCVYIQVKRRMRNRGEIMALANGFLALIKPHAIILVPGFIAGLVYGEKKQKKVNIIIDTIKYLAIFAVVRWGIGGIIDGELSQGIFGGAYEEMGKSIRDIKIGDVIYVASRHILAWIIMIPMIVIYRKQRCTDKKSNGRRIKMLEISVWTMTAMSIATYALFTVMVDTGWNNQLTRVHLRYYIYLLPLIVIVIVENLLKTEWNRVGAKKTLIRGIGITLAIASIGLFTQNNYTPLKYSWIETPTLAYIQNFENIQLLILAIVLIFIGSINKRGVIFSGSICLIGLVSSEILQTIQMTNATKDSKRSIRNMEEIRTYTAQGKVDIMLKNDGTVYGTRKDMIECMKMLFNQKKESYKDSCRKKRGRDIAGYEVFLGKENRFRTSEKNKYCELAKNDRIEGKEYVLYKKRISNTNQEMSKKMSVSLTGVHDKEEWGYWAREEMVELRINDHYMETILVEMKVRSIGSGEVKVGDKTYKIGRESWSKIKTDLPKTITCTNSIEINYKGDKIVQNGRELTFAIKDIKLERK